MQQGRDKNLLQHRPAAPHAKSDGCDKQAHNTLLVDKHALKPNLMPSRVVRK